MIGLSERTYIDKVLDRFNITNSKKGFLPMSHSMSLSKKHCPMTLDELEKISKSPYASAIGSIMYAIICTRPDVSCALSMTSKYQLCPGNDHCITVKNILKFLNKTSDKFLVFRDVSELCVKGYTDANFQTCKDDFQSQSSYIFTLNGATLSWKNSKQSTVVDSTTELSILLLLKQQRKLFGLEILFSSLVWFLVLLVQLNFIVIMMGLLYKQKNLDHTKSPNTCFESFISCDKS